jgi:hypothetical protein
MNLKAVVAKKEPVGSSTVVQSIAKAKAGVIKG